MKYIRSLLVIILGLFLSAFHLKKPVRRSNDVSLGGYVEAGDVDSPADLTAKGWKAALKQTKTAMKNKDLSLTASGLAYSATLTFFPALLGVASLYTAIAGSSGLVKVLNSLHSVVPPAIRSLVENELAPLTHASRGSLGLATIISLVLVLWTTSGGVSNLIKGTNIAYSVREGRGTIKLRLLSIVLSLVFIVFALVIAALLIVQSSSLRTFGVPSELASWLPWLRWPILVFLITLILAVIYRYAPNRENPKWAWVSWGAAAATILWLIITILFFFYVQHFGNYNHSYGTFASIIILMIWFNLSSLAVLVGAQVNSKLEAVADVPTTD